MSRLTFIIEGIRGVPEEWVDRWIEYWNSMGKHYTKDDFTYKPKT